MQHLQLRAEQKVIFQNLALEKFTQETAEIYSRKLNIPLTTEFIQVIGSRIIRARKFGIQKKGNIRLFLEYSFKYGDDFDTEKSSHWFSSTLHNKNLTGDEGMERIRREALIEEANVSQT